MALKVYNTLSGGLEEFTPLVPGQVGMYVCGVTVYDRSHIGHARALVTFDVVYRYLRFLGYQVRFVRNFTDVDDKIIDRARANGIDTAALTEINIRAFAEDMAVLRCLPPTVEPRATDHIPEMISLIRELQEKDLAYAVDGDVYFAVDRFHGYGKLSKRRLEDMVAGARVEVDERKRHPMDFALWKASKPGEPKWDSPWGPGRPGWHIECSAMSAVYLGQPFDIHGGGSDLIFPHHENEIAQSEGARGKPLARYWLHNGMVTVGHEKMSKSLGNFMTVQQAAEQVGGEALRLFVLGTHYRSPLDSSLERLQESKRALARMYETLARADSLGPQPSASDAPEYGAVLQEFRAGMDDDFNTARGLATMFDTLRALNRHLDAGEREAAAACRAALADIGGVLGIGMEAPQAVLERTRSELLQEALLRPEEIERLITERVAARKARDFARADAIRAELKSKGVVLEDTPQGTVWRAER